MNYTIRPIGTVINSRIDVSDDFWGGVISEIRLDPSFSDNALDGIDAFSHLEIIYVFHRAVNDQPGTASSHPRENPRWPRTGIFAQRKKNRPNFIGTAMVTLLKKEGASIFVTDLDAINGTPVIDIKPVMKGFLPRGPVRQPAWVDELMENYWKEPDCGRAVSIHRDGFLQAIDDHCDFACYYLDRETGEIIFQSERHYGDSAGDDEGAEYFNYEDYSAERFILIEPMESPRGREIMDCFIGSLPDCPAAKELSRAMAGRKPFRRFKDALHNHPDLEARWHALHDGDIINVAEEWLRRHGIHYEFISLNDITK
jgi:tRNA (adenine37-N6)-methyltransferase